MFKSYSQWSLEIEKHTPSNHLDVEELSWSLVLQCEEVSKSKNTIMSISVYAFGSVMLGLMVIVCKMAYASNPKLNGFDYLFVRSGGTVISACLPMYAGKVNPIGFERKYRCSLFWVMMLNWVAMPWYYVALQFVPPTKASVCYNSNPVVISILGVILLKEVISYREYGWILGAFLGIICLTMSKTSTGANGVDYSFFIGGYDYIQAVGLLMWFFTCITSAITTLFLRVFNKNNNVALFAFYYAISLSLSNVLLLLGDIGINGIANTVIYNLSEYRPYETILFMISGLLNIAACSWFSYSLKIGEASVVAPYMYLSAIVVLASDVLMFKYSFTLLDMTGFVLIITCLILKLRLSK